MGKNKKGFVFTNAIGGHYSQQYVHKKFKNVVQSIEMPSLRFHDLRHTYAVAAIRAGDDIKKPYLKISAMRLWLLPWIFMVMLPMR